MSKEFYPPFIVIPISLNADGDGPETDQEKIARTVWEVWDNACQTVSSHDTEDEAIAARDKISSEHR